MKTACSSWSYHHTIAAGKMDQMGFLDCCAAMELDGVELLSNHFPSTDGDYLRKLKKACTDRFLSIPLVSAPGHLTVADDAQRAAEVEMLKGWLEVAKVLGAPRMRFFVGRGDEMTAGGEALYAKIVDAVRQIVAAGAAEGITLAMENHGDTTAEQLLRLRKDVDSEYFAYTLDTGNFPPASRVHEGTYRSIEQCAPYASVVHAKFFNVTDSGQDADFDWHRIRGILAHAGFRGFLSIEYEGKDTNEPAIVPRIARFLRTLR